MGCCESNEYPPLYENTKETLETKEILEAKERLHD